MLEFVQKFQTIVTASIGFTGVIITLLANAYLSRRAESRRIRGERTALLAAFYAELANIQELIAEANLYMAKANELHVKRQEIKVDVPYLFQPSRRPVYESNVANIGLLGQRLSNLIVAAYSSVATFEAVVSVITVQPSSIGGPRLISGEYSDYAVYFVGKALDNVTQAISEIKQALPKEEQKGLLIWKYRPYHSPFRRSGQIPKTIDRE